MLWIDDEPVTHELEYEEPPAARPEAEKARDGAGTVVSGKDAGDWQTERAQLIARIDNLEQTVLSLQRADGISPPITLDDQQVLQEVGIYRYHHPLEDAVAYKQRLAEIDSRIDSMTRSGQAVLASDLFTFNGSLAKGRKMVGDQAKLMLRAYNAEADNCVRSLRAGNIQTARRRLEASVTAIAKLGSMMEMRVNPEYHAVRLEELELTSDFQVKVQEERERAREEREQLREQRRAEQELAARRVHLDKERLHYETVLDSVRARGDEAATADLEQRLAEIARAIELNDFRIANIRAGYVYVISNVGAFGQGVVKVGLTRRQEPLDRVRELGDASVPFPFDVHVLHFSKDAVTLETELHQALANCRVNHVNLRREFFFATPARVRELLVEKIGTLLEFTEEPDATQFFQSRGSWPAEFRSRPVSAGPIPEGSPSSV